MNWHRSQNWLLVKEGVVDIVGIWCRKGNVLVPPFNTIRIYPTIIKECSRSIKKLFKTYHSFSKISGIELNTEKTEILRIGDEYIEKEYIIVDTDGNEIISLKFQSPTPPCETSFTNVPQVWSCFSREISIQGKADFPVLFLHFTNRLFFILRKLTPHWLNVETLILKQAMITLRGMAEYFDTKSWKNCHQK